MEGRGEGERGVRGVGEGEGMEGKEKRGRSEGGRRGGE